MTEYRTPSNPVPTPSQDAMVQYSLYREAVAAYLSSHRIDGLDAETTCAVTVQTDSAPYNAAVLEGLLTQPSESFSQLLLRLADNRSMSHVELYKTAGIDRKIFSHIRHDLQYRPSKSTVIAFVLALELSLDETADLMSRAGYAFSPANRSDLIIRFFIENRVYDPAIINAALYEHNLPTLFFGMT